MIKKSFVFAYTFLLFSYALCAQESGPYTIKQPWVTNPSLHKVPEVFKGQSAVFLMDSRTHHYKMVDKELFQFNYVYKLIKVTDDKGIEMFNRIYLPLTQNAEIFDIKARVITSAGKTIDVPADKIKEVTEDGSRYKLFAMEGVDKGAEIEYSYTVKQSPVFFGSEIYHGKVVPHYQAKLLIIAPGHLRFKAKGFNGFRILADSVINDEYYIPGFSENIIEIDDEKYGLRDPYLQRADFKLSFNLAKNSDVELYTWKELAMNAYYNVTRVTEKEKKAIAKFVAAARIPADATEERKIMLLEDYMKNTINVDEKLVSENATNIEAIIKSGNTNNFGSVRLLAAMLENLGVKYQAVFPSPRNKLPLDEELANWNRIDETLIYFPGTGKYVEPSASAIRYPFVDPYWAGGRGLFIKGTTIGDVKTAIGKFDNIAIIPFEENASNMEVQASIDDSGDSLIINSKQILTGYSAMSYRPLWVYLAADKQEEALKEIIQSVAKSENITNIKCENTKLTDCWDNKPLIIGGTIHTAELLEKAGDKILFKLGELIGTQAQMYQEKARRLPAEVAYAHVLERKISFNIPAGYVIKNPESIVIDVQHKKDNVLTMGFVSSYKIENNLLKVHVMETYKELKYSLAEFETFKKVINAAADFNKVVLVLAKKS